MIPLLIWTIAVAYAGRSLVSSALFHRVWSFLIVSFFALIEVTRLQETWRLVFLWAWPTIFVFALCVLLSPAQVFIFPSSPDLTSKFRDIWEPADSQDIKAEYAC